MQRSDGGSVSLSLSLKIKKSPPSPWLVVHYHGGGFVAQTSKSHEVCFSSVLTELGMLIFFNIKPGLTSQKNIKTIA